MRKIFLALVAILFLLPALAGADTYTIKLPLSGVSDPVRSSGLSGVSEQAASTHELLIGNSTALNRAGTVPQVLLFETVEINPLSGVTPTDLTTGMSIYAVNSAATPYTLHSGCTAVSGVTFQFFYKESLTADADWSLLEMKPMTPELTIGGNTAYMRPTVMVGGQYIKPYFEGGTTAWATVEARIAFVDAGTGYSPEPWPMSHASADFATTGLTTFVVGLGAAPAGCRCIEIQATGADAAYSAPATSGVSKMLVEDNPALQMPINEYNTGSYGPGAGIAGTINAQYWTDCPGK